MVTANLTIYQIVLTAKKKPFSNERLSYGLGCFLYDSRSGLQNFL
jgi:hypothetical protein